MISFVQRGHFFLHFFFKTVYLLNFIFNLVALSPVGVNACGSMERCRWLAVVVVVVVGGGGVC